MYFTRPADMDSTIAPALQSEELIIAELEQLGVRYLSRQTQLQAVGLRPAHQLLADLLRQPTSRVRTAVIALLLAQPSFARAVTAALAELTAEEALILKLFYTAAVVLQEQYHDELTEYCGIEGRLPDRFSKELGLPSTTPKEQLAALGQYHRQATGMSLNWAGTYDSAARNLIRRRKIEKKWSL